MPFKTCINIHLKEAFNLLGGAKLSSTVSLIVSYWINFFLCHVLQAFDLGDWPQQFRARQSSN